MVVGNRGGKEQIVAALLYIFPVGIGSREKKEERRKKKKEERKRRGGKGTIVLFRLSRVARLTLAPFFSFPFRMFNYQGVKSNAISFRREFSSHSPVPSASGGKR